MSRPTWSGAVDLGGFPVNIVLFNRLAGPKKAEGFRMLSPKTGGPVGQWYIDSDGNKYTQGECDKGVEVGPDKFKKLTKEALEKITAAERTSLAEPAKFADLDSIDLTLNTGQYKAVADPKEANAENSYKVLWQGLRDRKLAYVTQIVFRANSVDGIVALYAKEDGIYAVTLPYPEQVQDLPEVEVKKDPKAAKVFGAFVDAHYEDLLGEYDPSEFTSAHRERKLALIESVKKGKTPKAQPAAKVEDAAPNLMDALEATLAQKKPKAKATGAQVAARRTKAKAKRTKVTT